MYAFFAILGNAILYAMLFFFAGAFLGFVVGLGLGAFNEIIFDTPSPQAPMIFMITGPLGIIVGFIYGIFKGSQKHIDE